MKIEHIRINNFLGARRIEMGITKPITLIAGPNGASKSSIHEALRLAFNGELLRVELKRDYPLLVSDGAKDGQVVITTDAGVARYALPKGEQALEGDLAKADLSALPFVLNAQAFATLPPEKRRTFLFAMTNCNVTAAEVQRRLIEKECEKDKVDLVLPMLRGGFPAASEFAAKKATESKGAWKQLTGETYGTKKGESWTAEKPEVDTEALAAAAAVVVEIEAKQQAAFQKKGALDAKIGQRESERRTTADIRKKAAELPALEQQLIVSEKAVEEYTASVAELTAKAGTGPRVGLIHDMAKFLSEIEFADPTDEQRQKNLITTYELAHGKISGEGDPKAAADLPAHQRSLQLSKNTVAALRDQVTRAKDAKGKLETLGETDASADEADKAALLQLKQELEALALERADASTKHINLKQIADRAATADKRTDEAKAEHDKIIAWLKIAEQLAPDGIPAEILATALKPVNKALQSAAAVTGWRQARIETDMSITADGRPYSLHCESEKWRIDAMIAAAISELSGIGILLLDRFDVLDLPSRGDLIIWLDELAKRGAFNTAIVCGTMKGAPMGLPDTIQPIWMEEGVIVTEELQAA